MSNQIIPSVTRPPADEGSQDAKRFVNHEYTDTLAAENKALRARVQELEVALNDLYVLVPDCDGDYLLDGKKGEFALKAIRVPGIGEACLKARAALLSAAGNTPKDRGR
jgi:hypothetical protein